MKIIHLAITLVASLSLFVVCHVVYADNIASFAKIDVIYDSSTNTLGITGMVYKTFSQYYALTIFNPQGQLISVSQLQLSQDDTFSQSILLSNTVWSESGNYTVKLASGSQILSVKSFYFPGVSCCATNSHGAQASLPATTSVIDSPLKQFKSGIVAKDVKCRQGLELIFKLEDSFPTCTTKPTAQTLVERGWGMYVPAVVEQGILSNSIKVQNTNFTINYNISGNNKLLDANMDMQSKSLVLSLSTTRNGTFTIVLPRDMIDAKLPTGQDDKYYVLVNGQESDFQEINATTINRTLSIPFANETQVIEIIASNII